MNSITLDGYESTVLSMGLAAGLLVAQLLVADVAALRAKHAPGTPIDADHGSFLFRAARAHANTNESIAAFGLLALFSILIAADAAWTNGLCLAYLAGRVGHMLCYWAGWSAARSASFGVSAIALVGLFLNGIWTLA